MFGPGARRLFPALLKSTVRPTITQTQKRWITFGPGTEGLLNVKNKAGVLDPTIAKNIAEIDAVDKRIGQETLVVRDGLMNHFNPTQRTVFLPAGHDNPVTASHELQHARDFAKLDALPTQEVLERRAFSAQQKTAQHLGIDDELKGQTPEQRAASHSQIKKT